MHCHDCGHANLPGEDFGASGSAGRDQRRRISQFDLKLQQMNAEFALSRGQMAAEMALRREQMAIEAQVCPRESGNHTREQSPRLGEDVRIGGEMG